jgi:hypothetical protein
LAFDILKAPVGLHCSIDSYYSQITLKDIKKNPSLSARIFDCFINWHKFLERENTSGNKLFREINTASNILFLSSFFRDTSLFDSYESSDLKSNWSRWADFQYDIYISNESNNEQKNNSEKHKSAEVKNVQLYEDREKKMYVLKKKSLVRVKRSKKIVALPKICTEMKKNSKLKVQTKEVKADTALSFIDDMDHEWTDDLCQNTTYSPLHTLGDLSPILEENNEEQADAFGFGTSSCISSNSEKMIDTET